MARPKTEKPLKKTLNLTVNEETKKILANLSQQRTMSISAMVEEWAAKEVQKEHINTDA